MLTKVVIIDKLKLCSVLVGLLVTTITNQMKIDVWSRCEYRLKLAFKWEIISQEYLAKNKENKVVHMEQDYLAMK